MNNGSKVAVFETGWVGVPWGFRGFRRRWLFLRVRTGCREHWKVRRWRVGGPDKGAGDQALWPGGSRPCLGAVLPPGPQAPRLPRAGPRVLGTPCPAPPLPTRREPPVTCRRCWAAAPLAHNLRSPGSGSGSRPARRCLETGANTAPALWEPRDSCCPAARGTSGSGCSGPTTPTLTRRKSREGRVPQ